MLIARALPDAKTTVPYLYMLFLDGPLASNYDLREVNESFGNSRVSPEWDWRKGLFWHEWIRSWSSVMELENSFAPNEKAGYPEAEAAMLAGLSSLFAEWHGRAQGNLPDGVRAADLVWDGFYPFYTAQSKRILFVGREGRGIAGCHYIDVLLPAYRKEKVIGGVPLNNCRMHRRMFYVTYGVNNDFPAYSDVPNAAKLAETFATRNGISFAFMNLSKISNEEESWVTNWGRVDASLKVSKASVCLEESEIEILRPDVVISMNLGERLKCLGKLTCIERTPEVNAYHLDAGRAKGILLLDTWHFAAPSKKDEEHYYNPILKAIRKHGG